MDDKVQLVELNSTDPEEVLKVKNYLKDLFRKTKDASVMKVVYNYYLSHNTARIDEVIYIVNEPHDIHFFDRVAEGLKSDQKIHHLTILGQIVRMNPLWLYKISKHNVLKELINLLKVETDVYIIVSGLLILIILLPLLQSLIAPYLQSIFNLFSKLAALNTSNAYHEAQLLHLQISLYTLFHRLYGMFPRNFVSFLQTEFSSTANDEKRTVFNHTVKPMLETVKFNPLLVSSSADWEIHTARWMNVEPHDVVTNCMNLLMCSYDSNMTPDCEIKTSIDWEHLWKLITDSKSTSDQCTEHVASPSGIYTANNKIVYTPSTAKSTPLRGFEFTTFDTSFEDTSPPEKALEATPDISVFSAHRAQATCTYQEMPSEVQEDCSQSQFHLSRPTMDKKSIRSLIADRVGITVSVHDGISLNTNNQHNDDLKNDSSHQSQHAMISNGNVNENGNGNGSSSVAPESGKNVLVEEPDECQREMTGSPCTSGGLHMPDLGRLNRFMRIRYHTYSEDAKNNSDTSQQNIDSFLNDESFRRTNSCPEIKKIIPSSGSSVDGFLGEDSLQENGHEEDDDIANDGYITNGGVSFITESKETQTDDVPLSAFPYAQLFMDIFSPPQRTLINNNCEVEQSLAVSHDYEEKYVKTILKQNAKNVKKKRIANEHLLRQQIELLGLQLQFEIYRRKLHEERNRRLLGRTRLNKTLKEQNSALRDQTKLLQIALEKALGDIQKNLSESKLEVDKHRSSSNHWKNEFSEMEIKYKEASKKCVELEINLKENEASIEKYTKSINEKQIELTEKNNIIEFNKKEAEIAKGWRRSLFEHTRDLIKAKEMLERYKQITKILTEMSLKNEQNKKLIKMFLANIKKLNADLASKKISLNAAIMQIYEAKNELSKTQKLLDETERQKMIMERTNEELKRSLTQKAKTISDLEHRQGLKVFNRFKETQSSISSSTSDSVSVPKVESPSKKG